jgi:hypothetical protein
MLDILNNPPASLTFTDILIMGIGLLLGIIGWFLRGFSQSVKELKIAVEKLMTTVAVEQERVSNVKDTINDFSVQLSSRVSNIASQVDKHEKDIAVLKTLENQYHNTIL